MSNNKAVKGDELVVDKKKRLVNEYLQKLIKAEPDSYYAPTSQIARGLHTMIMEHKNRMSVDNQALVKNLTIKEIEVILSYR